MTAVLASGLAAAGAAGLALLALEEPAWAASMLASGLAFGSISPLVAARRTAFLAAAAPHAALLAVAVAVAVAGGLTGDAAILSVIMGVAPVYAAGYAVYKGYDVDTVTYVFVSATASLSVIALYYSAAAGGAYAVSTLVIGDPLLATSREAAAALAVAVVVAAISLSTYRQQFYAGIDRDDFMLSGARLWLYDLAFFTALALAAVGLIRVVGFILEHVLILMPAALAFTLASRPGEAVALSLASAVAAVGLGGAAAMALDVAPAGAAGATLLILYILALLIGRGWRA